jgi:glucose-6-phosphate 1-dehydrogenase
VRLHIDNWRWAGVPFYLRTGKRLPRKTSEVTVVFREAPLRLFAGTPVSALKPDQLTIHIGPHEDISFQFLAKKPGSEIRVEPVQMDFAYDAAFTVQPAEAYERLLHDALVRDQTLFARADMVERAWEVVQPVLDDMPPLHFYRSGTWGPGAADDLIAPRLWHLR